MEERVGDGRGSGRGRERGGMEMCVREKERECENVREGRG